ncbi:hypothetical protein [Fundidesulfovibrio terrae]|uniref:hypothetical protein n=1 Tax=Fundidesulfovibrio terrae TaxID=2922866 RepID=UPI001FAEB461|nr:hypothetical protein [Fundidesulfovibrio terrae]
MHLDAQEILRRRQVFVRLKNWSNAFLIRSRFAERNGRFFDLIVPLLGSFGIAFFNNFIATFFDVRPQIRWLERENNLQKVLLPVDNRADRIDSFLPCT